VFTTGHSFLCLRESAQRVFFITVAIGFVDRMFTTFIQRAFTSIFDVSSGVATIACVYRARHAD
jgi:hypothetical protein